MPSDYHSDEVYANCAATLRPLATYAQGEDTVDSEGNTTGHKSFKPYYWTHPQYAFGADLRNIRFAYVQIAYRCERHQGEGGNSEYGWAIHKSWHPPGLGTKMRGFGDHEANYQLFADNSNGPGIFQGYDNSLVGCWLIFTTKETHHKGGSYPMWMCPTQGKDGCPEPDAGHSTENQVVIYTSPVISIEGQCREWSTYNHLYEAHVKGGGAPDDKSKSKLENLANKYAYRLRKYLYQILCPCHTCGDIDKGSHIAYNNCVPCLCKPTTTHSCWDPQANTFVPCPDPDDYKMQMVSKCIPCKPTKVYVGKGDRMEISMFCPKGSICNTKLQWPTLTSCQFGGTLAPVFDPTCIKSSDVKKLITEVNSLVEEAKLFRTAYLNRNPDGKLTVQWFEKKIGGLFPSEDRLAMQEVWEENPEYAKWTDKVKVEKMLDVPVQLKTLTTTCPPKITSWTTTSFKVQVKKDPPSYKTTTVSAKVVKWPESCTCDPICQALDWNTLICLCDKNQCISAKEMHSLLMTVSNKLQELLQSMCLPYRMVARKTFTDPSTYTNPNDGSIIACAAKKCVTVFPKNCNCIKKPLGTFTDEAIFKCKHSIDHTLYGTTYRWDSIPPPGSGTFTTTFSSQFTTIDSDCCAMSWPCTEDFFVAGHVLPPSDPDTVKHTQWYYNTWLYKGWQMMGQISLSDYIKQYFGYSWNPVPGCCHGTDCLGQWHFEILWRITQALLRGHYDQFQGGTQQMKAIYRFGMCGPPDCGGHPFIKEERIDPKPPHPIHYGETRTYEAPSCSDNPIIQSMTLPVAGWQELGMHGKMTVEGAKYWLKRSAKPYNRSYSAINVPEESDRLMVKDDHVADVSIMVDPQTSNDPVVQLQCCIIKLIGARWHMKDQIKGWDQGLLDKAILSEKGVPSSDKNMLLVSLVVDGLIDVAQMNELAEALGIRINHRIYTLLLHDDVLREKASKENDKLMMSGAIVDRKELETVVNSYMEDTMRLGNSLMSPDILYDNRMEMAKAFHEGSTFLDSVEESNSPSNEGCSSCRLNRIKKEMYEAFIKDVHTLDDDKKIEVLNHWAVILPTVTTLRIVEKLKYRNIGRHELVPAKYKAMKRIVMDVQMAIGDVMAATAAVKTLKRVDPSYKVWVESSCPELWANNPLIERTPIPADAVRYVMGATLSEQVKSKNSFIQEYWKALHVQLFGTDVDFNVAEPSPDLYLDRREKLPKYVQGKFGVKKPYWIVVCGYKSDHPLKHWGAPESGEFYQKVVDATPHINWVQMGKTGDDHHTHIQLRGVTSLLGLTNNNMRDMLALVYNAEGVLCPNTCYQHIAAAFPHVRCITIGGAREPSHWLDYGKSNQLHKYVNTIGKLPCSSDVMCKEPGTHFKNECSHKGDSGAPMCMEMITPDEIVELISKLT